MEPVLLTEDQIQSILQGFPDPPGIGKNAIRLAKKYRNRSLRIILSTVKLVPDPKAFEDVKEELIKSYYLALAEPGLPIGLTMAVSLSAPLTQLTLNTFHYAGAKSGTAQAFQKIKAFLTGSKTNPDPQTKLFFKKIGTGNDLHDVLHVGSFNDVLDRRPDIEQTTVADVVDGDPDILSRDQLEPLGISKMIQIHSQLRPSRYTRIDERYKLTYVARLKLNTYRMYTHRITMQMLAEAIEGNPPMNSITCIWQSQRDGYMYILIDETQDYSKGTMSLETSLLLFFGNLAKKFSLFLIRGIPGLSQLEPREIKVLSGIAQTKERGSELRVYTDNRRTRWHGISLADIGQLLEAAGYSVGPINKEKLYVPILNWSQFPKPKTSLANHLQNLINAAEKVPEPRRTFQDQQLIKASSFFIGITFGTNMDELVWRDDLDLFRTTGNSSHEVAEQIGIDASRVFMIFKFSQDLEDFSSPVNQRHVNTVFSLLTNLGMINSISFTGASRRKLGPLALASHERGLSVMVNSGAFGEREHLDGISPSIYVGQAPKKIGTHSVGIEEDLSVIAEDQPTLPVFDEITPLEGFSLEPTGLSIDDLINQGQTQEILPPAPVNKEQILNPSKIYSTGPPVPAAGVLPTPALKMASSTLQSALNKLTIGTNQIVEVAKPPRIIPSIDFPDRVSIPNITVLDSFEGIRLAPRTQLASPSMSEIPDSSIAELKAVDLPRSPQISVPSAQPEILSPQSLVSETLPGTKLGPVSSTFSLESVPVVVQPAQLSQPAIVTPAELPLPSITKKKPALQLFSTQTFSLVTPPPIIQNYPVKPKTPSEAPGTIAAPSTIAVPAPRPDVISPAVQFAPSSNTAASILAKVLHPGQLQQYSANLPVPSINVQEFDQIYRRLFPKISPTSPIALSS